MMMNYAWCIRCKGGERRLLLKYCGVSLSSRVWKDFDSLRHCYNVNEEKMRDRPCNYGLKVTNYELGVCSRFWVQISEFSTELLFLEYWFFFVLLSHGSQCVNTWAVIAVWNGSTFMCSITFFNSFLLLHWTARFQSRKLNDFLCILQLTWPNHLHAGGILHRRTSGRSRRSNSLNLNLFQYTCSSPQWGSYQATNLQP